MLVEEKVTHPLRQYDVDLGKWQDNFLHLPLQKGDFRGHPIHFDNLSSLFNNGGHVNTNNVFCAGLDRKPI